MKALVFNYRCADCGFVNKAPGLADMAYGEFIMFNDSDHAVYLNAITDVVFDEFRFLFKKIFNMYPQSSEENISHLLQAAFSITCDPSPDGSRYEINSFPSCKNCGSKKMASWGPANPIEFTDELSVPTHVEWNKLTDSGKKNRVNQAIKEFFNLK